MTVKFCKECGAQMQPLPTGKYDEETGMPTSRLACVNRKCEDGCGNTTNHINWKFWGNKCGDCGYWLPDY